MNQHNLTERRLRMTTRFMKRKSALSTKSLTYFSLIVFWLFTAAACTSSESVQENTTKTSVILVNSELVQGSNRFALALQDETGNLIHDAEVQLQYFDLTDADNPIPETTSTAVTVQSNDGRVTLYTDSRDFERDGAWGVAVTADLPDGSQTIQRISFNVLADSTAVSAGEPVPFVDTPTAVAANNDLSQISTAENPNPAFYLLSLKDALSNDKPTLLYFATPAFCQTKVCGPGYDEFNQLYRSIGSEFNMIHAEVFSDLNNPEENGWPLIPAMEAFGLKTEPWLYVIDSEGTAVYRVEGLFSAQEMEQTLRDLNLLN